MVIQDRFIIKKMFFENFHKTMENNGKSLQQSLFRIFVFYLLFTLIKFHFSFKIHNFHSNYLFVFYLFDCIFVSFSKNIFIIVSVPFAWCVDEITFKQFITILQLYLNFFFNSQYCQLIH